MGPFREHEEHKVRGKESGCSRIPRRVLHLHSPSDVKSPLTGSQFSEEEDSRDYVSRTTSTNSFCSDDTGCPSQSDFPFKTNSGSVGSGSVSPGQQKEELYRAQVDPAAKWNMLSVRLEEEQSSSQALRGSEGELSLSSSTGSLYAGAGRTLANERKKAGHTLANERKKAGHTLANERKKAGHTLANERKKVSYSHSRSSHTKGSHHPQRAPPSCTVVKDKELVSAIYRTAPKGLCSSSSSPISRKSNSGRYACGDSNGIKAPNPDQYLTPLQQKEVAVRHLKTMLNSDTRVQERDFEIEDLKAQLERMREDWIEEECRRVEAQLALQEARKEIRQLHYLVETMRCSLNEKDKGIQKYFSDINIQNRKLESLLHSMELAQSGCLQNDPSLDFSVLPTGSLAMLDGGLALEGQAAEEIADSGLLANDDEMANQADIFEQVLTSSIIAPVRHTHLSIGTQKLIPLHSTKGNTVPNTISLGENWCNTSEKATQTESTGIWEMQDLTSRLLKMHAAGMLPASVKSADLVSLLYMVTSGCFTPVVPVTKKCSNSGLCFGLADYSEDEEQHSMTTSQDVLDFTLGHSTDSTAKSECGLDMEVKELRLGVGQQGEQSLVVVEKVDWRTRFPVDLMTLAIAALPMVAWLYIILKRKAVPIGLLIRKSCIMGLNTLRRLCLGSNI